MMTSLAARLRRPFGLLFLAALLGVAAPIRALPPAGTCFAVVSRLQPAPATLRCTGRPAPGTDLMLRLPLPAAPSRRDIALVVHSTRFRALRVMFGYADGTRDAWTVRPGAFGDRWHVGGQIAFPARAGATLAAAWLRADGLESYALLRFRVVPRDRVDREFELCAVLVGAALALLALAAAYNLGLALAVRRRVFLWQGLWAATVLLWGLVWSQVALAWLPWLAGTPASRVATLLACAAVLWAALSTTGSLDAPRRLRGLIGILGGLVFVLGLLAALPGAALDRLAPMLAAATLLTLGAVASAIGLAWRRGQRHARDLALSWCLPMAVLAATQLVDFNTVLFGGGAQIAVLFASALQTIMLPALATRRLNTLRVERDAALASAERLAELAYRDALTGLLNRRGFMLRCEEAFGDLHGAPFALLLIDIDGFKRLNARFGHEAGDGVLATLGAALRAIERRHLCLAGRLGGDEFVVGVSGMPAVALRQFADAIRRELGAADHGAGFGRHPVTVSIGVAQGLAHGPLGALYGRADDALCHAKRAGRDQVEVFHEQATPGSGGEAVAVADDDGGQD